MGVVLLAAVAAWRLRRPRAVALATAVTAATAAAFVLLFPLSGRLFFLL